MTNDGDRSSELDLVDPSRASRWGIYECCELRR
jgi:hypothetical protein